jgi:hypothetical protein
VAEQRTFAIAEDDPRRARELNDLRVHLQEAAKLQWAPKDLEWLAQRAAAVGLPDLAVQLYARLSANDPDGRNKWDTQITRYALQVGDYRAAADAWFRQQAAARTRDEQRRCFVAGLRALQSGNLLDDALAAADAHGSTLADDPATLVVLLNLARAANRPQAVDRYAKMLARYTSIELREMPPQAQPSQRAQYAYMDGPVARPHDFVLASLREAMHGEAQNPRTVHVVRIATAASPARLTRTPASRTRYSRRSSNPATCPTRRKSPRNRCSAIRARQCGSSDSLKWRNGIAIPRLR